MLDLNEPSVQLNKFQKQTVCNALPFQTTAIYNGQHHLAQLSKVAFCRFPMLSFKDTDVATLVTWEVAYQALNDLGFIIEL